MDNIQWYPGHMTKAKRAMDQDIKLVDMIVEILDARCPISSRNPDIGKLGNGKKRILLLNKSDLADPAATEQWKKHFESQGYLVCTPDSRNNAAVREIKAILERLAKEKHEKDLKRGILNRPARVMIVGIPNVGKSTLINSLAGRASAKTGDKPGVTKGNQWIRLSGSLELLDTPGILWPKFEDQRVGLHLALIGSVNDQILSKTELAAEALTILEKLYPGAAAERFAFEKQNVYEQLEELAVKRCCLKKGGEPDVDRAAAQLVDELRKAKLGRISLEWAPAEGDKNV